MKALHAAAVVGLFSGGLLAAEPPAARAADITFSVIGPHEYELPVNFEPFGVFVQYAEFNSTKKYYLDDGGKASGDRTNLGVGLSKYVYFTTFDAMPNVGWAFEAIVPEVHVGQRRADDLNGVGDPLFGFATWIKPTENSTLGIQSFIQTPIGGDEVTNNYWSSLTSILFDVQFEKISFGGDVGAVFRSDRKGPGVDVDPGDSFHTNLRLGYKPGIPNVPLEPFLSLDFQTNSAASLHGSNVDGTKGHDLAVGLGASYAITKKYSVALWYSRGIDGRNVAATNAVYFKFAWVPFPIP